ncbi:MAG: hypothetical protein ACK5ME_06740 [Parahaliea sp.]
MSAFLYAGVVVLSVRTELICIADYCFINLAIKQMNPSLFDGYH